MKMSWVRFMLFTLSLTDRIQVTHRQKSLIRATFTWSLNVASMFKWRLKTNFNPLERKALWVFRLKL